MIKTKMLYATILMAFAATLLVNQASASQILVVAPSNDANQPPCYPWAFAYWGTDSVNDNGFSSTVDFDPLTGDTLLTLESYDDPEYPQPLPKAWLDTGWFQFIGPNQEGAVHADTWLKMDWSSNAPGYTGRGCLYEVTVYVYAMDMDGTWPYISQTWQATTGRTWWGIEYTTWTFAEAADPGIASFNTLSSPDSVPFQLAHNVGYRAVLELKASVWWGHLECQARLDDIVGRAYTETGSPTGPYIDATESYWVQAPNVTQIQLSPPSGPVGTKVAVNGTRFAQESQINIYFDNGFVNQTLSDSYGNCVCQFTVPSNSTKGPHRIKAVDAQNHTTYSFFDVSTGAWPLSNVDISGPNGVPDGKIDIWDLYPIATNYGETDPNVDPPESAAAQDISPSIPPLAFASAILIGLFTLRKNKTKEDQRAKTKQP